MTISIDPATVPVQPATADDEDGATPAGPGATGVTIATVERAADVLLELTRAPREGLGVPQLAAAIGMSRSATRRTLGSLRASGLVEVDESTHRYVLGVGALRLGVSYLNRIDVRRMARPALEDLSADTGETATLSVLLGERARVYVDQVTPDREVIVSVTLDQPYPLHVGASSRAFLAYLPEAHLERHLAPTPRRLRSGVLVDGPDLPQLRRDLAQVRARGWATSTGERQDGAASVAAPVLQHDGRPVAVLSVCGPADRLAGSLGDCRDRLLAATGALSALLGWDPGPD
ncbi:IclR family transcriptional regulator [Nocardioides pantholopis]|uniref:IclR family transcriptional regulator n=1 Tax=Nocardioides pantholopis TaxID=2483798 RepID=UPI000FDB4D54|nr:IclR family transcriptional regulator [Nocardioides pantholopis]